MPWNEPGGDDKDPWSKGKSSDNSDGGSKGSSKGNSKGSPVDNIEDITRKMNDKIGGLFGKRSWVKAMAQVVLLW